LVGVRLDSEMQFSVPVVGAPGRAHVEYGHLRGACATPRGVEATRTLIVSAHNRGMCTVVKSHSYLVARVGLFVQGGAS
jgi:hypothetical protein